MATRPPPLLLTKRLTSFLHLNLSATVTTLLLLTPSGKLLAYASRPPVPVATLRTHGTVAASLYAIHSSGTDRETIDAALGPPTSTSTTTSTTTTPTPRRTAATAAAGATERDSRSRSDGGGGQHDNNDGPLAVTIQLESGSVLVIRRLRCGMLFVCMGPPDHPLAPPPPSSSRPQTQQTQQQHQQSLAGAISQSAATSAPNGNDDQASAAAPNGHSHHHNNHHHQTPSTSPPGPSQQSSQSQQHQPTSSLAAPPNFGSPSEAASVLSSATAQTGVSSGSSVGFGAGTAGVMVMRRHAEELARWLDDKLGTLEVPGDGLGGVL